MVYDTAEPGYQPNGRLIGTQRSPEVKKIPNQLKDASLEHLFPSPVLYFDWPGSDELNARLSEIILGMRNRSAGVVKTNRGGWQSDSDLQTWPYAEIDNLSERIIALTIEYISRTYGTQDTRHHTGWSIRAWANVNEKGNFNRTHDHLGRTSFFSGVYYVDVGSLDACGLPATGHTIFEDWTHVAVNALNNPAPCQRDFRMVPRNGRMLLFPAGLMHRVEKYMGDRPRITIAFNLHHPGFAVPRLAHRERAANWMWSNFRGVMILKTKVPEKLVALCSIPRVLASTPIPKPVSLASMRRYVSTAVSQAFALASERFEKFNGLE